MIVALVFSVRAQQLPFSVVETSIADMQDAMRQRRVTSRELVLQYLDRIARYDGRLNAIMALNPRALEEADLRDRERRQGRVRGPLHGIPIALKDNIHTTDMPTTGGALAFRGFVPPYDAALTRNLRNAGAIIIAKTHMTELANWVAAGMPGNYNAINGYGMNPYDPRPDPRPGFNDGRPALPLSGSSSGAGTAVSFWAANVGTETSGSILSPSNQALLVGVKPTVGRISRYGIIPITADQDTAGPMARTVEDAAIILGVLEGAAPDARDPATATCPRVPSNDYTRFLRRQGLSGARLGVPRKVFVDQARHGALIGEAIAVLRAQGATIVDPADIPHQPMWPVCSGPNQAKGKDEGCSVVFKYGMKRDFNAWLQSLGPRSPVKTLTELREWNRKFESAGAIKYGQAQLDNSDEMELAADRARYRADRDKDVKLSGPEGIGAVLQGERLDAVIFAGNAGVAVAAKPGYPTVIVPFGFVANAPAPPFRTGSTRSQRRWGSALRGCRAPSRGCSRSPTRSSRRPSGACRPRSSHDATVLILWSC